MENWKNIPGFPKYYMVSDLGNIRNSETGENFKPFLSNSFYPAVTLFNGVRCKAYLVHRLVLLAFIGPTKLHVDHINGIKTDNRLVNLRYVTQKQNVRYYQTKKYEQKQRLKMLLLPEYRNTF